MLHRWFRQDTDYTLHDIHLNEDRGNFGLLANTCYWIFCIDYVTDRKHFCHHYKSSDCKPVNKLALFIRI